jgi:hypothetical protein
MKRLWWVVGGAVLIGAVLIMAILVAPKSPIPPAVQKSLTSTLLVPKSSDIVVSRESSKYDSKDKLLSFSVAYAGTSIVMSEQPTPTQFVDIPAVYDKVVEGMTNYSSFDVNIGTVHLTTPKQLAGKQAAVLNTKGTLLFAKPGKNLTDDQWRKFFNSFAVQN